MVSDFSREFIFMIDVVESLQLRWHFMGVTNERIGLLTSISPIQPGNYPNPDSNPSLTLLTVTDPQSLTLNHNLSLFLRINYAVRDCK